MQTFAPFVLENLDCDGTEERLLDCPGPRAMTELNYLAHNNADDAYDTPISYYYNGASFPDGCGNVFSTAMVACGMLSGPGATTCCECLELQVKAPIFTGSREAISQEAMEAFFGVASVQTAWLGIALHVMCFL